jgi:hypothetical protein
MDVIARRPRAARARPGQAARSAAARLPVRLGTERRNRAGTRMDSDGLGWTRMDSDGLGWTRMDSDDRLGWTPSRWTQMDSEGHSGTRRDSEGLGGTRMIDSDGLG